MFYIKINKFNKDETEDRFGRSRFFLNNFTSSYHWNLITLYPLSFFSRNII